MAPTEGRVAKPERRWGCPGPVNTATACETTLTVSSRAECLHRQLTAGETLVMCYHPYHQSSPELTNTHSPLYNRQHCQQTVNLHSLTSRFSLVDWGALCTMQHQKNFHSKSDTLTASVGFKTHRGILCLLKMHSMHFSLKHLHRYSNNNKYMQAFVGHEYVTRQRLWSLMEGFLEVADHWKDSELTIFLLIKQVILLHVHYICCITILCNLSDKKPSKTPSNIIKLPTLSICHLQLWLRRHAYIIINDWNNTGITITTPWTNGRPSRVKIRK